MLAPAGDTQNVGICQGVAKERLKDHTRYREGAPEGGGGEHAGKPHVEEDSPGLLREWGPAGQQIHQ